MKMLHAAAAFTFAALSPVLAVTASPVLANDTANDTAETNASALTIDSPIETLMANEATKAIVLKHLGPLDQHPFYGQFKSMTLPQVQPMSNGAITAETIEKIKIELAAL